MYSRVFSNNDVNLPPDYGGVTYHKRSEESEHDRPREERAEQIENEQRRAGYDRAQEAYRASGQEDRREPRRPLYSDPHTPPPPPGEKPAPKAPPFFSGRGFSIDDVILAGLILLLIGDRDGANKPDNELLLILGLLLLTK